MRYYAVVDTNVIVSALLNPSATPGQVVVEALEGCIIPLYNDEILLEYHDVLRRARFKFDLDTVRLMIDTIIQRGFAIDAGPIEDALPDPEDTAFYAVVMEKRKTDSAYLITGNLKHFPRTHFVVTPKEMLEIIRGTENEFEAVTR